MITLSEETLKELLRYSWWRGQETSQYHPYPQGKACRDAREILKDYLDEQSEEPKNE